MEKGAVVKRAGGEEGRVEKWQSASDGIGFVCSSRELARLVPSP